MPDDGNLLLRTSLQDEPPGLRLQVSDTGIGIIPEDGDRIFDPFFTRKSDGTGLGLSICRQILEQHGAHMEVTSAPGAGTTFHVIFPLVSLGVTDR
jgi:signal transduction histidine kinase